MRVGRHIENKIAPLVDESDDYIGNRELGQKLTSGKEMEQSTIHPRHQTDLASFLLSFPPTVTVPVPVPVTVGFSSLLICLSLCLCLTHLVRSSFVRLPQREPQQGQKQRHSFKHRGERRKRSEEKRSMGNQARMGWRAWSRFGEMRASIGGTIRN